MPAVTVAQFRRLWAEFHNRAARGAYFVPSDKPEPGAERIYLDKFARRIPCAGCRKHWRQVLAQHPPDFRSRSRYFNWTVRVHNAINRLLGKPTVAVWTAKKIWGFDSRSLAR